MTMLPIAAIHSPNCFPPTFFQVPNRDRRRGKSGKSGNRSLREKFSLPSITYPLVIQLLMLFMLVSYVYCFFFIFVAVDDYGCLYKYVDEVSTKYNIVGESYLEWTSIR